MKRRTRPVAALGALGLVLAALVVRGGFGVRGAEPVVIDRSSDADGVLTIAWAGDTMLGDAALPTLAERGYDWPFAEVSGLLGADVSIVNHEAPITTIASPYVPDKSYAYAVAPVAASALASAGVDVLGLGNNHAMDMGPEGLADTFAHAEAAGLAAFGAGSDLAEAERPLLIRGDGVTVGVVSLGKGYGSDVMAGRVRAGTVSMSEASIARGYALARKFGADYVVAFVHWGENYVPGIMPDQHHVATWFSEAGYDLVIGHGPHIAQQATMIDDMPVFYSLGNFVFGTGGRFTETAPGRGLVLTTAFTADGLTGLDVTCIATDNDVVAFQPQPCDADTAGAVKRTLGIPSVIDRVGSLP